VYDWEKNNEKEKIKNEILRQLRKRDPLSIYEGDEEVNDIGFI
jgi:hypothetical protein